MSRTSKRFTQNTLLIQSIKELGGLNPVAVAALPLSAVYYIIGLSITQDMRSTSFLRVTYWIGITLLVVMGILYAVAVSKQDFKRQTFCGAWLCGYAGGGCTISMFNKDYDYEKIRTFSIIFFILFVAILIGEYIYPKFSSKKNDILIGNLNKCYLEFSDSNLCGISYSNITDSGDGAYFELEYTDIRQARWAQVSAQGKQYYNLYIDSKHGTYNLSVDDSKTASEYVNKAVADVKAGREIVFPERKSLFGNHDSQYSSAVPLSQRTQGIGEWVCPQCGKINQNYVGTCGCGQVKPK
ncbi:MAG: hypothetical protein IJ451_06515 [Ruminococcus sp.]|nr:hypothetical protein [Ruminococcus sp.]